MIHHKEYEFSMAISQDDMEHSTGHYELTYGWSVDEYNKYNGINEELRLIEKALKPDDTQLLKVKVEASSLRFLTDEREDLLLRIDCMERLIAAEKQLTNLQFSSEAKKLSQSIAYIPESPFKNEITSRLDTLVWKLPKKEYDNSKTLDSKLMDQSLKEAGKDFINLGNEARTFVVRKVNSEYSNDATVQDVKEETMKLRKAVESVVHIADEAEIVHQLSRLPLEIFHGLSDHEKMEIASNLPSMDMTSEIKELERWIRIKIEKKDQISDEKNVVDTLNICVDNEGNIKEQEIKVGIVANNLS